MPWADQGKHRQKKAELIENPSLRLLHTLAWNLGYTVRDLICSMGTDELAGWSAWLEDYDPAIERRAQFAKLAYYAANGQRFRNAPQYRELCREFGLPIEDDEGDSRVRTLAGARKLLSVFGGMPKHVAERFNGDSGNSNDSA